MIDIRPRVASRLEPPRLSGWKVDAEADHSVVVTPPTGNACTIGLEGLGGKELSALGDSDFLWISSLVYLPSLIEQGRPLIAHKVLESYWTELNGKGGRSRIPSSQDHLVAQRLHAIAYLIDNGFTDDHVRLIFESDVEWALKPRNMATNNHGLMLCLALLDCLPSIAEPTYQLKVEGVAAGAILKILDTVLGDDGFCDENSPFYAHLYNIKIREILDKHKRSLWRFDILESVEEHARRATEALSKITYENGLIPAIGDSSENNSPYLGEPGTYSSPRTGFWIHKTNNLYVSMRAGAASSIHRHADDLSLVVRYGGSDFISDSGFHSFNYSDPRVRMLRSQRGHSGLYFPKYDDLINGELFGRNRISSTVRNESTARLTRVRASYTIDQQHTAYRTLEVEKSTIKVSDSYYSTSNLTPVQRFIVPQEVSIEISEKEVALTRDGMRLSIRVEYPCAIKVFSGENEPPYRGWRSTAPRQLVEGQCVEIAPLDEAVNSLPLTINLPV